MLENIIKILLALFLIYVAARLGTAAYFRSKFDFEKRRLQDDKAAKREGREGQ